MRLVTGCHDSGLMPLIDETDAGHPGNGRIGLDLRLIFKHGILFQQKDGGAI